MTPLDNASECMPGKGVRAVALFEAAKGQLILLAGCGVLTLLHADAQRLAEDVIAHFHLNPASRYPRIFLDLAGNLTNTRLWWLASFAFMYACLRFIEAYGLWRNRLWAEWFAALSSAIYVPFELFELTKSLSVLRLVTLTINLIIVAYMSGILISRYRQLT